MQSLNERIGHFYDRSTGIWLDTWGEHMHHGYYGEEGEEKKNHVQAQLDLIEQLLSWGEVTEANRILDPGCGVGGSSRYLAKRFGAESLGLTLSGVQVKRGNAYSAQAGLSQQVQLQARDMMTLNAEDGQFDLVWSMESAEHIEDKRRLLEIFYERLRPGGRFVMATWCHRLTPPALEAAEHKVLQSIYDLYHLPPMVSVEKLGQLAQEVGFSAVQTDDWSQSVAPFWKAVIQSALSLKSIGGLFKAGLPTIRGAWAMRYMTRGYRLGTVRFGLLKGQKPL
jgi:tocopherol O-methyltransferase